MGGYNNTEFIEKLIRKMPMRNKYDLDIVIRWKRKIDPNYMKNMLRR